MASPAQQLLETTEAEVSSTRDFSRGWGSLCMSRALPLVQISEKGSISLSSLQDPALKQKGKNGLNHPDSLVSKGKNSHSQIYPAQGRFLMQSA